MSTMNGNWRKLIARTFCICFYLFSWMHLNCTQIAIQWNTIYATQWTSTIYISMQNVQLSSQCLTYYLGPWPCYFAAAMLLLFLCGCCLECIKCFSLILNYWGTLREMKHITHFTQFIHWIKCLHFIAINISMNIFNSNSNA